MTTHQYSDNGEILPTEIGGPALDTDRETGATFASVPIEPIVVGAPLAIHEPEPTTASVPAREESDHAAR